MLAAAIRSQAERIVTYNLADFPPGVPDDYDIQAIHPDAFLLDLVDLFPQPVLDVLRRQVGNLKRGSVSLEDLLAQLEHKNHLYRFIAQVRLYLLARLGTDGVEHIHDAVEPLLADRRSLAGPLAHAAAGRDGPAAPVLPAEAALRQRAPDDRADSLVERERHQFPLIFSPHQRVVDLVGHVAGPAAGVGHPQRFHQMPAGEIRAGDVAHLAALHQRVQCAQRLLHRGPRIEAMDGVDVDVLRAEAA